MGQLLLGGNDDSGHEAWQESIESIIISNVLQRSQIGATMCDMQTYLYMWLQIFDLILDSSLGLWAGIQCAGEMKTTNMYITRARG